MATVTYDGQRVDAAEAITNWTNWGANPTQEGDYKYQGTYCVSVQVKTAEVGTYLIDPGGTVDFETTPKVALFKAIQTNYTAIDGNGFQLYIGNDSSNHYRYEIFTAATYPPLGGFQVVPIDPNVAGYITQTVGTMANNQSIDFYGIKSDANATAKAPNLGIDAVDYVDSGTGLSLDGTSGTFTDFITYDEGTSTNRYGIITTRSGIIYVNGVLTIGSSTATTFSDANRVLVFPDTRTNDGFCGIDIDLQNASSTVTLDSCTFSGRGSYGADGSTADTRPIFDVINAAGSASFDGCAFLAHNEVNFTSACSMDGGSIEARVLTQSGCEIENVTISTASFSGIACLDAPTFGTTTGLHDIIFNQDNDGHALELDTATSYTLTNIFFNNYGIIGNGDAAIYVSAPTGTCTLNIVGGNSPTYRTAGATVDIVLNPVTFLVTVTDIDTTLAVSGARVLVAVADGTNYPYQASVTITGTGTTATVSHTGHGLATNDNIIIAGANEDVYNGAYSITVTGPNAYTYTTNETITVSPATGTILTTFAVINGTTDVNGQISDSRTYASGDQDVEGWARNASGSPYYKQQPISDTIDASSGKSINVQLIRDE
jgi:hypothetical protein